jgi:hypothetical protein
MPIKTAYSTKDLQDVVADLHAQCGDCHPRAVIFFASSKYDPVDLSRQMQTGFPEACVAGCSTAGEIAGGKMITDSVAAMFLDEEIVGTAFSAVVQNLRGQVQLDDAFAQLERQVHAPVASLDIEKYVGVVLVDGLSGAEEALMEKLGDAADILFVGGSAGDDLKFQSTHVMAGGKAYSNAAVLLLLEVKHGFDIVKTQSFQPTDKTLVATEVDEPLRMVIQFNHKPAIEAYAEVLGVPPQQAPDYFMRHPLGLMVHGDPFVRSPQHVDNRGIVFYCQIKEGMELAVLNATDIVSHTRQALEARKATGQAISGIIDFQCILRTLQLRAEERCAQYGSIFEGIPSAGFSTYGEAYLGHMNQTSTMLVFR